MKKKQENLNQSEIDQKKENIEAQGLEKVDLELEKTENKIQEFEEKIVRLLAEMENQRRRFEKEKEEAFNYGGFNFAKETLSLIDNLERAKISISSDESIKQNKDLPKFLENLDIIQNDIISIFKKNGIESINCLNNKFDPNLHQAMIEIEDQNIEPGTVVQEIQKGFMIKERLLRPSLVAVSKKKIEEKKENNLKNDENKPKNDKKT